MPKYLIWGVLCPELAAAEQTALCAHEEPRHKRGSKPDANSTNPALVPGAALGGSGQGISQCFLLKRLEIIVPRVYFFFFFEKRTKTHSVRKGPCQHPPSFLGLPFHQKHPYLPWHFITSEILLLIHTNRKPSTKHLSLYTTSITSPR